MIIELKEELKQASELISRTENLVRVVLSGQRSSFKPRRVGGREYP